MSRKSIKSGGTTGGAKSIKVVVKDVNTIDVNEQNSHSPSKLETKSNLFLKKQTTIIKPFALSVNEQELSSFKINDVFYL